MIVWDAEALRSRPFQLSNVQNVQHKTRGVLPTRFSSQQPPLTGWQRRAFPPSWLPGSWRCPGPRTPGWHLQARCPGALTRTPTRHVQATRRLNHRIGMDICLKYSSGHYFASKTLNFRSFRLTFLFKKHRIQFHLIKRDPCEDGLLEQSCIVL